MGTRIFFFFGIYSIYIQLEMALQSTKKSTNISIYIFAVIFCPTPKAQDQILEAQTTQSYIHLLDRLIRAILHSLSNCKSTSETKRKGKIKIKNKIK